MGMSLSWSAGRRGRFRVSMQVFILEDEIDRYPRNQIKDVFGVNHNLTIAKSCEEGIKLFPTVFGGYDLILLDHDMEGNYEYRDEYPNTGYQFVKWLVDKLRPCGEVWLHSHNPVGRKRMRELLEDHGWNIGGEIPFSPKYVEALKKIA